MRTITVEADVDIEDIVACMSVEDRRAMLDTLRKEFQESAGPSLPELYEAFRLGRRERVDQILREIFYEQLGRVA